MKKTKFSQWLLALAAVSVFTACSDDNEPDEVNEEELITTVSIEFTSNTGDVKVFTFQDLDAEGPDTPVVTLDTLLANTTYSGSVRFLNATEDPAESITEEVREEADEHQVFFQVSGGLNLTHAYNDTDDEGKPVGLLNNFTTGAASTGKLTVILRHEPNKDAAGVADGDITNAGGETDIQVEFDVVVQ